MQEIRNSCGFSCGRYLQLVIKGLPYAEVKGYFAILSPLCQQASKKYSALLKKQGKIV